MEQIVEAKGQTEESILAEDQILELSLDLLPNVGGGTVGMKI